MIQRIIAEYDEERRCMRINGEMDGERLIEVSLRLFEIFAKRMSEKERRILMYCLLHMITPEACKEAEDEEAVDDLLNKALGGMENE